MVCTYIRIIVSIIIRYNIIISFQEFGTRFGLDVLIQGPLHQKIIAYLVRQWSIHETSTVADIRDVDSGRYTRHWQWPIYETSTVADIRYIDSGRYTRRRQWPMYEPMYETLTVADIRYIDSGRYTRRRVVYALRGVKTTCLTLRGVKVQSKRTLNKYFTYIHAQMLYEKTTAWFSVFILI